MKQLSIKKRVTMWYAVTLVVLLAGIILALYIVDDKLAHENLKSSLTQTVDQSISDVKVFDGILTIDEDIDTYIDGTSILVTRKNGFVITGLYPNDNLEDKAFVPDEVRLVKCKTNGETLEYYIYDRKIENEKAGTFWVRGITSASIEDINPLFDKRNIWILILIFGIVTIIALIGGYYITNRAFRPLGKINDTADKIQAGNDLSVRILSPQEADAHSTDEIYRTAMTFDNMLERLDESFRSEKQFTDDASHELRTPTAVIMAASEYALGNLDDRDEVEESLQTISAQSYKISALIEKLLMFARADRGALVVHKEEFNLSNMLDALVGIMTPKAEDQGVQLTSYIAKDINISADQPLIERMFENIIGNAITYTNSGGSVNISLSKDLNKTDDSSDSNGIIARILDTGIGISDEDIPKVWNRFYRVDAARTASDGNNMGLGLAVVQWIALQHDIDIEIKSEVGVGTEFILRF